MRIFSEKDIIHYNNVNDWFYYYIGGRDGRLKNIQIEEQVLGDLGKLQWELISIYRLKQEEFNKIIFKNLIILLKENEVILFRNIILLFKY